MDITSKPESEGKVLLKNLIDDLSLTANLYPRIVQSMNAYLYQELSKYIILEDESSAVLTDYLYSLEDEKVYSILALSSVTTPYLCLLLPHINQLLTQVWSGYIIKFKKDFPEFQSHELGKQIRKLHDFYHNFRGLIYIEVRSTRKSIGDKKPVWETPGLEALEAFYKCERKRKYATLEEATLALERGQESYACPRCGNYHNGHPMTNQEIPVSIQHKRWETTWRRLHNV